MKFIEPYIGAFKALAVLCVALALLWIGHRFGAQGVQAKWDRETAQRKADENAAVMSRIRNNERIVEQQAIDKQRMKKGHADEIAQIRAAYAADRGLRLNADVCAGLAEGAKADGAGRGDGTTSGSIALPDEIERDLRALMLEADTVVASCRVAQEFIRSNGMAP